MGSVGKNDVLSSSDLSAYAPAYDYAGEDSDRSDINTSYFEGVENMPVNTNLNDWVDEANGEYTTWEKGTLQSYMDNSDINSKLRDNPDLANAVTRNLDTIISNHTLDKDTILYSGLSNDSVKNLALDTLKAGDTFKIPAYVSTSPDPIYAAGYTLSGSGTPTVLQISAPAGTNIAKMYFDSAYGTEGLLARNSAFEVVSKRQGKINGESVRIVRVRIRK